MKTINTLLKELKDKFDRPVSYYKKEDYLQMIQALRQIILPVFENTSNIDKLWEKIGSYPDIQFEDPSEQLEELKTSIENLSTKIEESLLKWEDE